MLNVKARNPNSPSTFIHFPYNPYTANAPELTTVNPITTCPDLTTILFENCLPLSQTKCRIPFQL